MSDEGPWDADPQPPGWYPDPWGTDDLRWWNGVEWSDRVSSEATSDPAEPDPAQRNGARFVGVLIVVMLAVVLWDVIGDGPADDDPQATQGQEPDEPLSEPEAVEEPAPPPAPETSIAMEGDGDMSSDPFVLDPGDYVVEWTASDCSTGFSLKPLDDQWPYVRLATSGDANDGRDNVFDVEGGRWYLNVITGPSPGCPWTLTLEPR